MIDAGSSPVGAGIDTSQFAAAMARLSRRAQVWYRLPHDTKQHLSHRSRVRQFWEKWDALASERKCILDKKRLTQADLRKLDDSYRETNERLIDCPCPRLSRVARLAKVDVTESLPRPTCATYAILGRFPTYVGQVGAKAKNRKRPPMRRQRDHFRKAKQLQGHYMGRRARNLRRTPFFGKCPSLPRLLARAGPHACTMRLLQETPPTLLNMTKHKCEQMLGPCSNAVTPYEWPQRVDWLLEGAFHLSASGSIRQLVSEVLDCKDLKSRFSVRGGLCQQKRLMHCTEKSTVISSPATGWMSRSEFLSIFLYPTKICPSR